MSRLASTLDPGDNMLRGERVSRPKLPKALYYRLRTNGLKRTRIKRISKGLKAEQSKYRTISAAFLARPENKFCIICVVRREHGENILVNLATEVHHWAGRIKRLLCYVPFFKPSCRSCRDWPHENKTKARLWGLLAPITQWNRFPVNGRE